MADTTLPRTEAIAAWRKALEAHAALKRKQKAKRTSFDLIHSNELKASRAIVTKAKKVAERLALAELAAEADPADDAAQAGDEE